VLHGGLNSKGSVDLRGHSPRPKHNCKLLLRPPPRANRNEERFCVLPCPKLLWTFKIKRVLDERVRMQGYGWLKDRILGEDGRRQQMQLRELGLIAEQLGSSLAQLAIGISVGHTHSLSDHVVIHLSFHLLWRPSSVTQGRRNIHCVPKNIPDIFNCILKTNYQILIISGTNIPDTTCHQMTIQFPTPPIVRFCTT